MSAAFDEARGQIVYFGGYVSGIARAETWIFNGSTFTKLPPLTTPPAQQFHSMAYDSAHQQVVLVLGNDITTHTWTWGGTNWASHTPVTSPTARDRPVIGYDKAHGQVVLFGGIIYPSTFLTDTWVWNGTNWQNMNPVNHPAPSGDFRGMAFDEARNELVLSGGRLSSGTNETWAWDGANWQQRFPTNDMPTRSIFGMAYDRIHQEIVSFGGEVYPYGVSDTNDTWAWNGANWLQKSPDVVPDPREGHNMVFDSVRGVVAMQGGAGPGILFSNAWFWDGSNWKLYGYPKVLSRIPSTANGGSILPGLTQLTLQFNKLIDRSSFTNNFSLDGQMGHRQVAITYLTNRYYRIDFSPLTEEGPYHFTILPTLLDTDGLQLNQNGNSVPGETNDGYSFTLNVDTTPPRLTQHAPAGDVAGTITNVDVWFSEALNTSTFTAADVSMFNPTNGPIVASNIKGVGFNRFRIAFPPQTMLGQYHVFIGTNLTDAAGNTLKVSNNNLPPGIAYDATLNLVAVDLGLTNVIVSTNQFFAGDPITVSWQGMNRSGAPLLGDWIDAVYLSSDAQWDINDIQLATVPHPGGLTNNETYSASANVYVPGLLPGNYRILVRADIANQEKEGLGEADNLAVSAPLSLSVRTLPSAGGAFSGVLTPSAPFAYYAIKVLAGQSLLLNLTSQSANGAAALFLGAGTIPTRQQFDQRATTNGLNLQLALSNISSNSQSYYFLVYGDQINGSLPFNLAGQTRPLFLTGITPARLGNLFSATVTLTGAGFDDTTTVDFLATNGTIFPSDGIELVSSATLRLNLNLTNWPAGLYTVRAVKGAATSQLSNAFEVVQGGVAHLETRLIVPSSVGYNLPVRQTIWIEYENTGIIPMPAPLLVLRGDHGSRMTADPAIPPRGGFGPISGASDTVQVLGLGSSSTPWILQPGESGRIPAYYLGLDQYYPVHPLVTFTLSNVTEEDAGLIDWTSLETAIRPAGMDNTRWASYFAQIQNYYGTTWGGYVKKLDDAAAFRSEISDEVPTDVANIFRLSAYQMALNGVPQSTANPPTMPPGNANQQLSDYPLADILSGNIESPYGWRRFNLSSGHPHYGIDIAHSQYFPLGAIGGGLGWIAAYAGDVGEGILDVTLNGPNGEHFEYLHVDVETINIYRNTVGQIVPLSNVQKNQRIALCGNTGPGELGYHLHLQRGRVGPSPWPLLKALANYHSAPPTISEGPAGQGYVQGNDVFLSLQISTKSMDLESATISLVQVIGANCQAQTPFFQPITMSVEGTTPAFGIRPDWLIWEGSSRSPYANVWSLERVIRGLPAGVQWTFRVTATTYAGVSSSKEFTYAATTPCQPSGTPGIKVEPTSGLVTTESGGSASFSVVLLSMPTNNVSVPVSSDNTDEGTASTSSLTFTPNNWNTKQFVAVTGVEDSGQVDGDIPYNVILGQAVSGDMRYASIDPDDVSLVNMDNDGTNGLPGIAVSPISGLRTSESGALATFSVALRSAPTADVSVHLSSSNPNEGSLGATTSLTFTPGNWSVAQAVTVSGVDDTNCDGNVSYSVAVGPATSQDSDYNGKSGPSVSLINEDNEGNQCNCQQAGTCPPPIPPPPPPCTGNCGGQTSQTVSSFDPNEKFGPAGFGALAFVSRDGALAYSVRFENKSDATAPARQVVVSDTLDASLDLNTLELTEITFANRILPVPAGLNHYEARVPVTVTNATSTNNIVVDVQAALDAPTRTLTLTLSALDPNTGWFPEDPLVGLLYPNDSSGRGVGSLSYLIKPKAAVPTGTQIPNRAHITFDYNDPIDTPQTMNTIDAVAPSSTVLPLPATNTPNFVVQWSGQDDFGGSGIASFDIYSSTNGTLFTPWLQNTTANSAMFTGSPGVTYAFFSVARDNVGNVTNITPFAQATTTVTTNVAPVLAGISNQVLNVGGFLVISNRLLSSSGRPLTFSLGPGAPSGARINPTNGVLRWHPSPAQGSTTNQITVIVNDDGPPAQSGSVTFTVSVSDYVSASFGSTVVLAGQGGSVPVNAFSSTALTNLNLTLLVPSNRFNSFALSNFAPQISGGFALPLPDATIALLFTNYAGQVLAGPVQMGVLYFNTVSNQHSAFVPLQSADILATKPDGSLVSPTETGPGRVAIVGPEPLLEAVISSNRPDLILYGHPGWTYQMEVTTNFQDWQNAWFVPMTNLVNTTTGILIPQSGVFFRASTTNGSSQ